MLHYTLLSQIPPSRKIEHTGSKDGQVQFKTEEWKDLYMLTFQVDTADASKLSINVVKLHCYC